MPTDFKRIRSGDDLAVYLPCSSELVADRIADDTSSFVYHAIRKRDPRRGVREVWACESPIILQALKAFSHRSTSSPAHTSSGFRIQPRTDT
jgi:hypothetical protein